jgi:hypothetical protein
MTHVVVAFGPVDPDQQHRSAPFVWTFAPGLEEAAAT